MLLTLERAREDAAKLLCYNSAEELMETDVNHALRHGGDDALIRAQLYLIDLIIRSESPVRVKRLSVLAEGLPDVQFKRYSTEHPSIERASRGEDEAEVLFLSTGVKGPVGFGYKRTDFGIAPVIPVPSYGEMWDVTVRGENKGPSLTQRDAEDEAYARATRWKEKADKAR